MSLDHNQVAYYKILYFDFCKRIEKYGNYILYCFPTTVFSEIYRH